MICMGPDAGMFLIFDGSGEPLVEAGDGEREDADPQKQQAGELLDQVREAGALEQAGAQDLDVVAHPGWGQTPAARAPESFMALLLPLREVLAYHGADCLLRQEDLR